MSRWDDFWAKLLARIDKWLEGQRVEVDPPTNDPRVDPKPEPIPTPDNSADAIPITSISWLGTDYSSAKQTATLSISHIDNSTQSLSDAPPATWVKKIVKVEVQAILCLFYQKGDKIVGGKYDWLKPGQRSKGLKNIYDGYDGHSMPSTGTPTYTCFVDVVGKQRSNICECTWK
jgi:hypothetical protein